MSRQARDQTHNELVVDIRSVTQNLPDSIEAMLYLTTSSAELTLSRTNNPNPNPNPKPGDVLPDHLVGRGD